MKNKYLSFIILITFLFIKISSAQDVKINEVYHSVTDQNSPNFIELINQSDEQVSLLGYTLEINNIIDTLISENYQYILEPHEIILVVNLSADSTTITNSYPQDVKIFTLMNEKFNLFRNVENSIVLHNEYKDVVDNLVFSQNTKANFSLENNSMLNQWGESKIEFGTPGGKNSLLIESVDLTIDDILWENDKFTVSISNIGLKPVTGATLIIANDINLNSIIDDNEILKTEQFDVSENDSILLEVDVKLDKPGFYSIIAEVNSPEDQVTTNNLVQKIITIPFPKSSLLINEFMYAPESGESEYVELYNNSEEDINLQYWQIGDQSGSDVITENELILKSHNYLAVAEDSAYFDQWSEERALLLAPLPSLNNSGDSIKIIDPSQLVIDSLYYTSSWGNKRGVSLEKTDPEAASNSTINWEQSIHELGGTPGFVNSVNLKDFDLAIVADSTGIPVEKIFSGDTVDFIYTIKNIGKENSKEFKISIYKSPSDTLFIEPDTTIDYLSLEKGLSFMDTVQISFTDPGLHYIKTEIQYAEDENVENNGDIKMIAVGFPNKSMVINEIMYDPETGKPEWFEVANISGKPINAKNWLFRDSQNTIHIATEQSIEIPADSFAVISNADMSLYENFSGILLQSATFPTLNNSGDSLILLDPVGNYIDSLEFSSEWGNSKGVSLERKSTEQESNSFINWSLSKNEKGSTPGFTNSIALKDFDLGIDTIYLKKENILENQDAVLVLKIENNGSKTITNFDLAINVYNDITKQIVISEKYLNVQKTISAGYYTRYEVPLIAISGGVHPVEAKIYTSKDNIIENNEFNTNIKIGYEMNSIVVNEIMYSPHSGEAEWIELFNTSGTKIDLNNWLFKDISDKILTLCDSVNYIESEEYVVIASNKEIFESYPEITCNILMPEKFPTLNNTSDATIIFDAIGHRIDSVYYMKNWGGNVGVSVERRNPFVPAISTENWGSSTDTLGGTPGMRNSILKYDYDLAVDEFYFHTEETYAFTENYFSIEIKNNGIYESGAYSIKIFHDKNTDDYPEEEELVWSLHNIPSLDVDSTSAIEGKIYSENSGRSHYIAKVVLNTEENLADNESTANLKIEFEELALVLNEFLPAPETGMTEFLECINNTEFDVVLQGWELSNEWHSAIIDFDTKIPSGQYVVFCSDSSIFVNYPPINCPVYVLEDWPGMNNSADKIILKDLTGKPIDSLAYSEGWNVKYGKSFEKIMPSDPSADSSSWKISESEHGATPGKFNSISPYVYDLKINDMWISGTNGNSETLFDIKFYIENIGRDRCEDAEIQIYDVKFNSKSLYRTSKIKDMDFRTSDSLSMQLSNLDKGYHNFLAQINWSKDQNVDNDTISFAIDISYELNDLYISEFMANPKTVKSKGVSIAEYIEIYNPQNKSVHIHNWTISDENSAEQLPIISQKTIPAESYFVIANDSTVFNFPDANSNNTVVLKKWPSLNNDADKILITDPTGIIIDSLVYSSEWKIEQGDSKEKIYMENENFLSNWRSSASPQGGTPGIVNSVVVAQTETKTGLQSNPNPFTPDGDGKDDEVGFFYTLSFPSANIRIDIYDLTGRLIASPMENMRTAAESVVYWDGTNKYGELARVGMYIARITATDANSKKSEGHIATFTLMK